MKIITEEKLNNMDFDISDDLYIIQNVLDMSPEDIEVELGINDIYNPSRDELDRLYDYCYDQGLYLNEIKWLSYKEEVSNSNNVILCHGSRKGIRGDIRLDLNTEENNDFGHGFYCGENLKQAGMFVSDEPTSSLYIISFRKNRLKAATFTVSNEWMFAVAYYRGLLSDYYDSPIIKKIINKVESSDYVIAPIADNRIFELIDAFANGYLTDKQTRYALSSTHLGYQYVFKKSDCLNNIKILEHCPLCNIERANYVKSTEAESNTSLNKALLAKKKYDGEGKYIHELLR